MARKVYFQLQEHHSLNDVLSRKALSIYLFQLVLSLEQQSPNSSQSSILHFEGAKCIPYISVYHHTHKEGNSKNILQ